VGRISPEAPVPIVAIRTRTCVPGGAGNTAANVAKLGGRAALAGVVGADASAGRLRDAFAQQGVAHDGLLIDSERATTTKTRIVAHQQHVVRIDEEQLTPLSRDLEDKLMHWLDQHMPGTDACILSDYAKGIVSPRLAQHTIGLAKETRKPVVVDPKGIDYAKYRGATVVKPNMEEAKLVARLEGSGDSFLAEIARHLLDLLPGSALLLTRGRDGMSLFEQGAAPLHIPSVAREVFDVTGAGDTVAGTLALALAAGASLDQASHLANRAAGVVVGKVGTAQASPEELFRSVRQPE
jgi:rfaE bifunctional protein kinase chain/domain